MTHQFHSDSPRTQLSKKVISPATESGEFAAAVADTDDANEIQQIADEQESPETTAPDVQPLPDVSTDEERAADELLTPGDSPSITDIFDAGPGAVDLYDVIASVHRAYPLLEAAFMEGLIADGNQLAAWGEFDTKFKAASENGPVGFYETYRQMIGISQPIYSGGEVFGGYRVGRGDFQPWYLERQTNDGGEFKAGMVIPLARNRDIDQRRAQLWRATYEQQRVRPEIRAQLIWFVREATVAYWTWVAAGQKYGIGQWALDLSLERNAKLERRVEEGDLDPPALKDNLRSIALRESKLIDRGRKLQQAAVKLSLFYRAPSGDPVVLDRPQLGAFPEPIAVEKSQMQGDAELALTQRPELIALDALSRKINVDLSEARNEYLPSVDAQIVSSQDVGKPTSSKRDKSPFELEAGIFIDVPFQRRKARGKTHAAQAKLAQVSAKRRYTENKIVADVQYAYAGLEAAYGRVGKAREARELAEYMADVERRKFELGQSDLLAVFIREQSAIEAADGEVDALLEYFTAAADYAAALADDWPAPAPTPNN